MLSASPNNLALPESARLDEVRSFCPLARPVVANFQLEPESRRHLRVNIAGSRAPLYCLRPPHRCPALGRSFQHAAPHLAIPGPLPLQPGVFIRNPDGKNRRGQASNEITCCARSVLGRFLPLFWCAAPSRLRQSLTTQPNISSCKHNAMKYSKVVFVMYILELRST